MRLEITRDSLKIIPETLHGYGEDCRDEAFIEAVLGLEKEGDWIKLIRRDAHGLSCLAYLETNKGE